MRSESSPLTIVGRRGPVLAAAVAAATALPGLWLPFLADDWANLAAVENGIPSGTPFLYFRPLYLATYWLERMVWGLSPALSHATNLVLAAVAAALVVVLLRRYTRDAELSGLAGLLFALHPYHVENTAWIAGRSDSLYAVLFLASAYAYDRWRASCRGLPVAALIGFEAALLAKEAAVALPLFLVVLGYCERSRRPERREWARGILPMVALALAHFLWLRPHGLAGPSLDVAHGLGLAAIKRLGTFLTAAILPAQTELIESATRIWFAGAVLSCLALVALSIVASRAVPKAAWAAAAVFLVLLGPALPISFQERYFFLPSAASAAGLAALLRAARPRVGLALGALLAAGWLLSIGDQWRGWHDAGVASTAMIAGLTEASRPAGISEIVVVNAPHRVHGAPVICDWRSAIRLSGGRPVTVIAAPYIDYVGPEAGILDGPYERAVTLPPPHAEVASVIPSKLFSRYVAPKIPAGSDRLEQGGVTIVLHRQGALNVRVLPAADGHRAAYLWSVGRLRRLF